MALMLPEAIFFCALTQINKLSSIATGIRIPAFKKSTEYNIYYDGEITGYYDTVFLFVRNDYSYKPYPELLFYKFKVLRQQPLSSALEQTADNR